VPHVSLLETWDVELQTFVAPRSENPDLGHPAFEVN